MITAQSPYPGLGRELGRGRLIPRARALRRNSTPWERKLWRYLRANRFYHFHFKRQVPIGTYIVDFSCRERKLVIELDGSHHALPENKVYDAKRETLLREEGYTILRFWNNEIDSNLNGVLEVIEEALAPPLS